MKNNELEKKALKAGTVFIAIQLMVKGISFLTTPIFTRLLSSEMYGESANAYSEKVIFPSR